MSQNYFIPPLPVSLWFFIIFLWCATNNRPPKNVPLYMDNPWQDIFRSRSSQNFGLGNYKKAKTLHLTSLLASLSQKFLDRQIFFSLRSLPHFLLPFVLSLNDNITNHKFQMKGEKKVKNLKLVLESSLSYVILFWYESTYFQMLNLQCIVKTKGSFYDHICNNECYLIEKK